MDAINWFEIPAVQFARAVKFYSTILGVELKQEEMPGCKMAVLPHGSSNVGGAIALAEGAKPSPDGVRVYLNGGKDLAEILDRVAAAGGAIVMPKTQISPEIGYIALFQDSEGNVLGLHSRP